MQKHVKKLKKIFKRNKHIMFLSVVALVLITLPLLHNREDVNTTQLLDTIAKGESRGNYNAYFGNAKNTEINFTAMTVSEVLAWQDEYVKKGSPSSAVGKYQFIRPTLHGLIEQLKIDKSTRFDETLQDRLAVALLERRGLHNYMKGKISRDQFAHNLSKEWAALPKVLGDKPEESYYAGDGLNKVQVSIEDVHSGIASLHH